VEKGLIIIAVAEVSNTTFKPDTKRSTQFAVSEFKRRCKVLQCGAKQ